MHGAHTLFAIEKDGKLIRVWTEAIQLYAIMEALPEEYANSKVVMLHLLEVEHRSGDEYNLVYRKVDMPQIRL